MHPYNGISAALGTQHGKEIQIAPHFEPLGISLVTSTFNTDELGTFTGEIPRSGGAVEAARGKARRAMDELKVPYGIASEGTFGPDPLIPLFNANVEIVIWLDDIREIEVVESYRTFEMVAISENIENLDELDDLLEQAKFPEHAVIVRGEGGTKPTIYKGLRDHKAVLNVVKKILREGQRVTIESDLRAHMNPTRQKAITEAARRLAARLSHVCSNCGSPGWGVVELLCGIECSECGGFNNEKPSGEILGCLRCGYRKDVKFKKEKIEPAECIFCNP